MFETFKKLMQVKQRRIEPETKENDQERKEEKYGQNVHTRIIFLRHAQAEGAKVTPVGRQTAQKFAEGQIAYEKRRFVRFPQLDPSDPRSDAGQRTRETSETIDSVFRGYEIDKVRAETEKPETQKEKNIANRKLHGKRGLLPVQKFSPEFMQKMLEVMKGYNDQKEGKRAMVSYYLDSTFTGSPDVETTSAHEMGEVLAKLATRLISATKRFPNKDESDIFLVGNSGPIDSLVKLLLEEFQNDLSWKGKELDELGGEIYNLEPVIIDIFRKDKSQYEAKLKYRDIDIPLDTEALNSLEKRRLEEKKKSLANADRERSTKL